MAKKKMIEIKMIKSDIGIKPNQAKTLKALGLSKVDQVVKKPDNEAIRGMIATVSHLVEIL
ncbi:MAG: 50S ribosomal protein L30 [Bacilli bacterium]|nr:50S ribosomal protein L30 [Bacilli bacterium]MDD4076438.1 50S ribosomal protein L30 [Bacilli bacterium]MDD4387967.1 50S ribosomal protein L30 [Bacilli bacterium]